MAMFYGAAYIRIEMTSDNGVKHNRVILYVFIIDVYMQDLQAPCSSCHCGQALFKNEPDCF